MKDNNKKVSSVEWLADQVEDYIGLIPTDIIDKAKAMHKQEIKDAWLSAWKDSMLDPLEDKYYQPEAEQYYNETFQ